MKVNRDDFKSSGKKEEDAEGGEVTKSEEDMERVLGKHSKPLPI